MGTVLQSLRRGAGEAPLGTGRLTCFQAIDLCIANKVCYLTFYMLCCRTQRRCSDSTHVEIASMLVFSVLACYQWLQRFLSFYFAFLSPVGVGSLGCPLLTCLIHYGSSGCIPSRYISEAERSEACRLKDTYSRPPARVPCFTPSPARVPG